MLDSGLWGNWLEAVKGWQGEREKVGSDGKWNWAADVKMQWDEKDGQNDAEDNDDNEEWELKG